MFMKILSINLGSTAPLDTIMVMKIVGYPTIPQLGVGLIRFMRL